MSPEIIPNTAANPVIATTVTTTEAVKAFNEALGMLKDYPVDMQQMLF